MANVSANVNGALFPDGCLYTYFSCLDPFFLFKSEREFCYVTKVNDSVTVIKWYAMQLFLFYPIVTLLFATCRLSGVKNLNNSRCFLQVGLWNIIAAVQPDLEISQPGNTCTLKSSLFLWLHIRIFKLFLIRSIVITLYFTPR